jgi:hypothetical protein
MGKFTPDESEIIQHCKHIKVASILNAGDRNSSSNPNVFTEDEFPLVISK